MPAHPSPGQTELLTSRIPASQPNKKPNPIQGNTMHRVDVDVRKLQPAAQPAQHQVPPILEAAVVQARLAVKQQQLQQLQQELDSLKSQLHLMQFHNQSGAANVLAADQQGQHTAQQEIQNHRSPSKHCSADIVAADVAESNVATAQDSSQAQQADRLVAAAAAGRQAPVQGCESQPTAPAAGAAGAAQAYARSAFQVCTPELSVPLPVGVHNHSAAAGDKQQQQQEQQEQEVGQPKAAGAVAAAAAAVPEAARMHGVQLMLPQHYQQHQQQQQQLNVPAAVNPNALQMVLAALQGDQQQQQQQPANVTAPLAEQDSHLRLMLQVLQSTAVRESQTGPTEQDTAAAAAGGRAALAAAAVNSQEPVQAPRPAAAAAGQQQAADLLAAPTAAAAAAAATLADLSISSPIPDYSFIHPLIAAAAAAAPAAAAARGDICRSSNWHVNNIAFKDRCLSLAAAAAEQQAALGRDLESLCWEDVTFLLQPIEFEMQNDGDLGQPIDTSRTIPQNQRVDATKTKAGGSKKGPGSGSSSGSSSGDHEGLEDPGTQGPVYTYYDFAQYFHLSAAAAAAAMGMGLTKFKTKIREMGIARWPGREYQALEEAASYLRSKSNDARDHALKPARLLLLKHLKCMLDKYPNMNLPAHPARELIDALHKQKYKKRKQEERSVAAAAAAAADGLDTVEVSMGEQEADPAVPAAAAGQLDLAAAAAAPGGLEDQLRVEPQLRQLRGRKRRKSLLKLQQQQRQQQQQEEEEEEEEWQQPKCVLVC